MAIQIRCPCGNVLDVPHILAGQSARCGSCGRYLQVPKKGQKPPASSGFPSAPAAPSPALAPRSAPPPASPIKPDPVTPTPVTSEEAITPTLASGTGGSLGRWMLYVGISALVVTFVLLSFVFLKPVLLESKKGAESLFEEKKEYRLELAVTPDEPGTSTTAATAPGPAAPRLTLDLESGLLNGLGVGSHVQHIRSVHRGIPYAKVDESLRHPDLGIQLDLREERITRITVFLRPKEKDGTVFKGYPGNVHPALDIRVAKADAIKLLGQPTEDRSTFISYLTKREDLVRLEFGDDGGLETLVLEESPQQQRLVRVRENTPERYPEAVQPYRLPDWKGDANFNLGNQVCLGLPLGVETSALRDLPESMQTDKQGGRATYPPTGFVVWFADQRIKQLAVFFRPEYSRSELKAFRGSITHGISRTISIDGLREKLGAENGYSENYRVRVLHYILEDRFFQFGFFPEGQKLVFAAMGLIGPEDQELLPKPLKGTLRALRDGAVLWRGQRVLAIAEVGALFPAVCETRDFFGVQCKPQGQLEYAWIAKGDARDTSEASVWVEVKARSRYRDDPNAGEKKILDAEFLSTSRHLVVAGTITKDPEQPSSKVHYVENLYALSQAAPFQSAKFDAISEIEPFPAEGRYLSLYNSETSLECAIRSYTSGQAGRKFKLLHDRGARCLALRLSENGKFLAAAWKEVIEIFEIPSGRQVHQLQTTEPILDVAISKDGNTVWILHVSRIVHWNILENLRESLPIRGRHGLYKVHGLPLALATYRNRDQQCPIVTAFEFPAGKEAWRSDDFLLIPPGLGGSDQSGGSLVGVSTRHRLAIALASASKGQIIKPLEMTSEETAGLSASDLRGLKISPDGNNVLAFFRNGLLLTCSPETGRVTGTYEGFFMQPDPASCTPAGDFFLIGGTELRLYASKANIAVRDFEPVPDPLTAVEIDPQKQFIVAGDAKGEVRLWNFSSGELLNTFSETPPLGPISKIRFVRGSQAILFSARNHSALTMIDMAPPYSKKTLSQGEAVHAFEISPDTNRCLALGVGPRTRLYLWELESLQRLQGVVVPQSSRTGSVTFSPAGGTGTVLLDGNFFEWPLDQRRGGMTVISLGNNYQPGPCLLSPDGALLFRFEGDNARIWDIPSRQAIGYADNMGLDSNYQFSFDGRSLIRAMNGKATVLQIVRVGAGKDASP